MGLRSAGPGSLGALRKPLVATTNGEGHYYNLLKIDLFVVPLVLVHDGCVVAIWHNLCHFMHEMVTFR